MFNRTESIEAEKKAWKVLADPSAPEKKWQAACKVVEGKEYQVSPLPKPVGLMLSLILSYSSAAGVTAILIMLFAATQLATPYLGYNQGMSWACLFLFFYVFNNIFTYQKLSWKGGKSWDITQGSLLAIAASLPILMTVIFTPSTLADPLTMINTGVWMGIVALGYKLGTILARDSIKNLNGPIGARKVFEPMKYGMTSGLAMISIVYLFPHPTMTALVSLFSLTTIFIAGTSYLAVRKTKSYRNSTSLSMGSFIWHPIFLATIVSWVLGTSAFIASGDFLNPITLPALFLFYATASVPLFFTYLCAGGGALAGTRQNRLELARELTEIPPSLKKGLAQNNTESFSQHQTIKKETA